MTHVTADTDPRRGAARASKAACGSSAAVGPQTSGAVCCRKGVGSSMADHRPRTRSTPAARLGALVTQLTAAGPTTPAAGSYVWPTGGVFIVRISRDRETERQRDRDRLAQTGVAFSIVGAVALGHPRCARPACTVRAGRLQWLAETHHRYGEGETRHGCVWLLHTAGHAAA